MKLTQRLMTIASFCEGGNRLIDVGCDHAKLPIYLVENGIIKQAVATDIRTGPLESAMKNIGIAGLSGVIKTNLCNGLDSFCSDDCDTIVIAGMGGEEIVSILQNAPWTKCESIRLVLQPQTMEPKVREWLCNNRFKIEKENIAVEGSKIYVVMLAIYSDEKIEEENMNLFSNALEACENRLLYIEKLVKRYSKQQEGQVIATGDSSLQLEKILSFLGEVNKKWQ